MNNKIVLITGAGKGIGYDLAKKLNNNKVKTYCILRDEKDLKKFKRLRNCITILGDITKINDIKKIFILAKKNKDEINCLVNNAGIRQKIKIKKLSNEKIREIFDINFFAQYNCIKLFLENKKKNIKASIVNIGSIVGQVGFKDLLGYASTKAALSGMTKCLALELGHENIRTNLVNPGFVKTSYYKKFKKKKNYTNGL